MDRRRRLQTLAAGMLVLPSVAAAALAGDGGFDHGDTAWNTLRRKHGRWLADGKQSRVGHTGFAADRAALHADQLASTPAERSGRRTALMRRAARRPSHQTTVRPPYPPAAPDAVGAT